MSIYDRDYMKSYAKKRFSTIGESASKVLIVANIVAFFIQAFGERIFGRLEFLEFFGLSCNSLLSGKVWTLFTYAFMHGDLFHIFCNLLGLYFVGKYVERIVGNKKFYVLYFSGVIFGALAWLLLQKMTGTSESLIGASAGVMAVFSSFCFLYPPMPITFLLFFVIPISMRPMTMLKLTVGFELLGLVSSLLGSNSVVAYSAHLGGIVAGLLFSLSLIKGKLAFVENLKFPTMPKRDKTSASRGGRAKDYSFKVNISNDEKSDDEIDRILDKITKSGFSSLSESEREILRNARDHLNR